MKKIYLLLLVFLAIGASRTNAQCSADFQYFTNAFNTSVQFIDSSFTPPGSAIAYFWDFGDGSISGVQNPTHTYAQSGTYLVCLSISDSLSNCTDSICRNITISGSQGNRCMTSFTYNVNPNNVVDFFSNVTGGTAPYTYNWSFGTGSGASTANPTHTFGSPGTYTISLTVTDANGLTCTYSDSVIVNSCSAFFSYTTSSNGTVSFTNMSNPLNAALPSITWDFGDGNFSNSIHTTHTYTSSGTYIVTLSYFDSLSNCSASYSDSLSILIGNPSSCNASYIIAKDSTVSYGVILYNNSSNFSSHVYTWDFGDGTTGSGRTPVHQYQNFGDYFVCLTISDTVLNCTSTFCDTVGMDSSGNLKSGGFGLRVEEPLAVGLNELDDNSSITVFPNPANHQISIDLSGLKNTTNLQVIDATGRVVLEQTSLQAGRIETVEIDHLKTGLYFMILNNGESQRMEKFIKQ